MRLQMVYGDEGKIVCGGDSLARHHADHHTPDQSGAAGCGDAAQIFERNFCVLQCRRNQSIEMIHVGTRGDFGNHTAERFVFFQLGEHKVSHDGFVVTDYGHCRFVARCFYPEYNHGRVLAGFGFIVIRPEDC